MLPHCTPFFRVCGTKWEHSQTYTIDANPNFLLLLENGEISFNTTYELQTQPKTDFIHVAKTMNCKPTCFCSRNKATEYKLSVFSIPVGAMNKHIPAVLFIANTPGWQVLWESIKTNGFSNTSSPSGIKHNMVFIFILWVQFFSFLK